MNEETSQIFEIIKENASQNKIVYETEEGIIITNISQTHKINKYYSFNIIYIIYIPCTFLLENNTKIIYYDSST